MAFPQPDATDQVVMLRPKDATPQVATREAARSYKGTPRGDRVMRRSAQMLAPIDEWSVLRARTITLATLAPLGDDLGVFTPRPVT
jgi:hypothetical protein